MLALLTCCTTTLVFSGVAGIAVCEASAVTVSGWLLADGAVAGDEGTTAGFVTGVEGVLGVVDACETV